jgi:MFS family permease
LGLSAGFLIGLAGSLVAAWSVINGSFIGFLAGAALLGGSRASSEQSRYVAAEVYPSASRSKVIGWIVFAGTIGAILGPLLVEPSAAMAESAGIAAFAGPFLVAGLMLLAAAIVTFILLRPDPQRIGKEVDAHEREQLAGEQVAEAPARPLREIFAGAFPLLAVAAMMIGQLVMVMLMVITPLHMNHNDHGTGAISLVIMAHTLGMFGLSGLTGWLVGRLGRLPMIAAGAVVLIISALLAPVSTEVPLLAIALFLLGLGWNFTFVAGSALLSDHLLPAERGRAQGAGEMAVAIGAGLGSLGSGIIFAGGGIEAVSLVGLGFSLALLAITAWVALVRRPAGVMVNN